MKNDLSKVIFKFYNTLDSIFVSDTLPLNAKKLSVKESFLCTSQEGLN